MFFGRYWSNQLISLPVRLACLAESSLTLTRWPEIRWTCLPVVNTQRISKRSLKYSTIFAIATSYQSGKFIIWGREPWSGDERRTLIIRGLSVWVSASDTRWTFFHINLLKNCIVWMKRPKINAKEAEGGQLKKYTLQP